MKYKVGDKVRIRSDLKVGERYGDFDFNKNMEQFKGKLVTICIDKIFYGIKEDDGYFSWSDEMIECKVYDDLDEFWNDWKNEKVCIKFNNSNDFDKFIDYHFKHFNIKLPKPNIEYFDTTKHVIYYTLMPDKWGLANNDEITDYNVITYDDFIKLVEKDEKSSKNDQKSNSQILQNTPEYSVFQNKNSNKNHILKENKIDKELNEKVEEEYNSVINKKEFDWNKFKNNEVGVIVRSDEEAKDFFTKMYNKFNINEYADYYRDDIMFDEDNSEFKIYYNKYIDYWCVDSCNKCNINFINWSDYMDKENTTQILKNTLGEPYVEKVVDTSIYKRIDDTKQDIKQAFVDIDTNVLYKIRELFDTIRYEKDIEKIKNILNIIYRLVITKNKVLNDFDIDMIDELNKEW